MADFFDEARQRFAEDCRRFDSMLIIALDRETKQMSNWWRIDGHPDTWTTSDLSSIAQQMAAFTAEELKTEANGAPRKVYIKQPTFTKMGKDDVVKGFTLLAGFSVRLNDRKKRLWMSLYFEEQEFGLALRWNRGISLVVGPFLFMAFITDRA